MYLKSYKELIVWQKSIELVKEIYKITNEFPKSEIYGLSSQMQRAVISIPSNIAEGYSRKNLKEYIQFLHIAYGSSAELETQLIISKELYQNINYKNAELFLEEILKMLNTMIIKLKNNNC
ncbi:MAG: four helix bundle protein [Candidatus Staskawiczbacteria bacterium]|nr:four helix bundle protein [Candidatus Staskawiczbacteria bacterium]